MEVKCLTVCYYLLSNKSLPVGKKTPSIGAEVQSQIYLCWFFLKDWACSFMSPLSSLHILSVWCSIWHQIYRHGQDNTQWHKWSTDAIMQIVREMDSDFHRWWMSSFYTFSSTGQTNSQFLNLKEGTKSHISVFVLTLGMTGPLALVSLQHVFTSHLLHIYLSVLCTSLCVKRAMKTSEFTHTVSEVRKCCQWLSM